MVNEAFYSSFTKKFMRNALMDYLLMQVGIWLFLIGWIWFVAKLGQRKVTKERQKRANLQERSGL